MGVRLDQHVRTLLDALAFAWPATAFAFRLNTPKPIAPVDDDDDDDDGERGGGSGGSIDPDDDDGGDAEDDEDDEDTLWIGCGLSRA